MIEHLKEIKKRLLSKDNYEEAMQYFLDHLSTNKKIFKFVKKREVPELVIGLKRMLAHQYKYHLITQGKPADHVPDEIDVKLQFFGLPKYGFYHGTILWEEGFGSYLYFKKDDIGIIAVTYRPHFETVITRFSVIKYVEGYYPVFNNNPDDIN